MVSVQVTRDLCDRPAVMYKQLVLG